MNDFLKNILLAASYQVKSGVNLIQTIDQIIFTPYDPSKHVIEWDDVREKVKEAKSNLPENVKPNEVTGKLEKTTVIETEGVISTEWETVDYTKVKRAATVSTLTKYDLHTLKLRMLDETRASEFKIKWAQNIGAERASEEFNSPKKKRGYGIRTIENYYSAFSYALSLQKREEGTNQPQLTAIGDK